MLIHWDLCHLHSMCSSALLWDFMGWRQPLVCYIQILLSSDVVYVDRPCQFVLSLPSEAKWCLWSCSWSSCGCKGHRTYKRLSTPIICQQPFGIDYSMPLMWEQILRREQPTSIQIRSYTVQVWVQFHCGTLSSMEANNVGQLGRKSSEMMLVLL